MILVKIGGGAALNLEGIAADLAELDAPFVVVHGANALRDELACALGREQRTLRSVSGYTSVYSDTTAIDLLMLAYAGLRNKRLVELLQLRGVRAVGLSGLDGRLIEGRRNRGIRVREGTKQLVIHDLSGKPTAVNRELLELLLGAGYRPVLCVPIADEEGRAINSENDDIVVLLQQALAAETVVQLIEAPGLLESADDPASRIERLSAEELGRREARAEGRFRRKLLALRRLAEGGGARVIVADGRTAHPLRDALAGLGTTIG